MPQTVFIFEHILLGHFPVFNGLLAYKFESLRVVWLQDGFGLNGLQDYLGADLICELDFGRLVFKQVGWGTLVEERVIAGDCDSLFFLRVI